MPTGYSVEVQGLDKLVKKLKGALEPLRPVFKELVELVERETEEATKPHPGDVGKLGRGDTIRSALAPSGQPLGGRVFTRSAIAIEVQEGRRPGRPPPVKAMTRWAERHTELIGAVTKKTGFRLARAIGRKGSRGVRFMEKGAEAGEKKAPELLRKAARDIERDWGR